MTGSVKVQFLDLILIGELITNENPTKRYQIDSTGKPLEIKWDFIEREKPYFSKILYFDNSSSNNLTPCGYNFVQEV